MIAREQWAEITRLELVLPRLNRSFDGFRLVHISDIHYGTWINKARLEEAIDWINGLKPDMVAITGDFVTHKPEKHAPELIPLFQELKAREGCVAVLGNHDHWSDPVVVSKIMTRSGIRNLSNQVYSICQGSELLHFAGVDCHYERMDRIDLVLEELPSHGAAILLAHEPDFARISVKTGRFDLQLSGHSHGGQLILPFIGPPVRPRFAWRYPVGKYHLNGMIQYTNRGLGTSRLRLRINCQPEITLFTLRAGERMDDYSDE